MHVRMSSPAFKRAAEFSMDCASTWALEAVYVHGIHTSHTGKPLAGPDLLAR